MRVLPVLSMAAFLVVLVGCVPSLHPLYTEADLVFTPELVGCWSEDNSKETWVFSKAGEKEYELVYTDEDGVPATLEAHLLKLDGEMFLDLFPDDSCVKGQNILCRMHLVPAHTFLRVTQVTPTLQMAFMNPEWMEKLIKATPDAIRHETVADDGMLLTASTKELQAFMRKHVHTKDVFGNLFNMTRRPLPEAEKGKAPGAN